MADFLQLLGASSKIKYTDKTVEKKYYRISSEQWTRIKKAACMLSDHNIGPYVIEAIDTNHTIVYKRVNPIYYEEDLNNSVLQHKLVNVVKQLHELGYGHGDLGNFQNIAIDPDTGNILLLDPDTIYNIENDRYSEFVKKWMNHGFGLNPESEIDWIEFVNNDYQLVEDISFLV